MVIILEGANGVGKSTIAEALSERISNSIVLHDPGSTPTAEKIRELVKDKDAKMQDETILLLYTAARVELAHQILQIDIGTTIILDRYILSTLVYQGLTVCPTVIRGLHEKHVPDFESVTFVLDCNEPWKRTGDQKHAESGGDRFESQGIEFMKKIQARYHNYAESLGYLIISTDCSVEDTVDYILKELGDG